MRGRNASRVLISGVMLLAFVARALIPQGFMPASDRTLSLQICPEGFPAKLLRHSGHHHAGGGNSFAEHCVFGAAAAAPTAQTAPPAYAPFVQLAPVAFSLDAAGVVRLVYLPHARGPPGGALS
jgi:hypothetical protein